MSNGGAVLAESLAENGVRHAYVLVGNQTVSTVQGLHDRGVQVVTARHECNAAVMADTYGRLTGEPGVVITVAGPGGTNALTGVAQAYTAASPVLCISAVLPEDAPTESLHGVDDPRFLQHAFEDATKWSTQVYDAGYLSETIARAFAVMTSGRPGPVFVGVDEELLMNEVDFDERPAGRDWPQFDRPPRSEVATACQPVVAAERRSLYVGKGVLRAFAAPDVVAFAEALDCPVVCPRHYPDAFPNDHELFAGTVGMADHPAARSALSNAEAVLSLGVRVGSHEAAVLEDRTPDDVAIVLFDDDRVESSPFDVAGIVAGDLANLVNSAEAELSDEVGITDGDYRASVLSERRRVEREIDAYYERVREQTPIHPLVIMKELRAATDDDVIITGDAGAAGGAWPNDAFEFRTPNTFQHSRLYDSMGFPVPAGNAAKLVQPGRQVVNLIGDGGFLMCNMGLATAVETETDAVTIVMNDSKYGMIWNYQRARGFDEVATTNPPTDFAAMAESFGVRGLGVERPEAVGPALEAALEAPEHTVLDIVVDAEAEYVSRAIW